ncbi:LysR family transcriptional regulator [Paeniglutamicibacter cryotolerans]|nr:LysR family transcriptional regulator [Paeniglutamicibacter cryotolerans]
MLPAALLYFHEVAGSGSITEAAEALHVSASAISRQITGLERSTGVELFRRHPRGMELTEAGTLLLAHTRRTEAESEELLSELRELASGKQRVLEIVASEGLAAYRVPAAIAAFCQEHEDVSVHFSVIPSTGATQRIIDGVADVAMVFALGPRRDVKVEFSCPAPAYAIVASAHPLAGRNRVGLAELCDYRLSLPSKGISQRELFDIAAQMEGLTPRIAMTTDHIKPAMEFVRSGAGVTLMSHFAHSEGVDDGLCFIPIDHPAFGERQAQILTMPGRRQSALLTAFIQKMSAVLAAG